jgi:hypothetical protein
MIVINSTILTTSPLIFSFCLFIYEVGESVITLKVKPSMSRSRQLAEASRISRQSTHEGGRFVSPTHRPLLAPRISPLYLLEAAICYYVISAFVESIVK